MCMEEEPWDHVILCEYNKKYRDEYVSKLKMIANKISKNKEAFLNFLINSCQFLSIFARNWGFSEQKQAQNYFIWSGFEVGTEKARLIEKIDIMYDVICQNWGCARWFYFLIVFLVLLHAKIHVFCCISLSVFNHLSWNSRDGCPYELGLWKHSDVPEFMKKIPKHIL